MTFRHAALAFAILTAPALVPLAFADPATPVQVAPPKAPPPSGEMSAADVTTWLAFFDKLVDVIVKTQGETCDKMASEISAVIDSNQAAIEVARTAKRQRKKLPPSARQHMLDGVKQMMPAMQKCAQHAKVRAAFMKLDLNRR